MPQVAISAIINSTEDEDRVKLAVLNLFPDAIVQVNEGALAATSSSLDYFAQRLMEQKIRDSSRAILRHAIIPGGIEFHLNKQAAFVGKINFTEGDSILGDLKVIIRVEDSEALVELITEVGQ